MFHIGVVTSHLHVSNDCYTTYVYVVGPRAETGHVRIVKWTLKGWNRSIGQPNKYPHARAHIHDLFFAHKRRSFRGHLIANDRQYMRVNVTLYNILTVWLTVQLPSSTQRTRFDGTSCSCRVSTANCTAVVYRIPTTPHRRGDNISVARSSERDRERTTSESYKTPRNNNNNNNNKKIQTM